MPFFTGPLPVQCGGGRRPGSLADATQDCSTSEDFSPRTVLTKNICRCVHHILQHFPTTMPFLTVSAITYSWMASTAPQADSWWLGHVEPDDVVIADIAGQALDIFLHGPESAHKNGFPKTFTHTSIPIHPCTLLKKKAKTTTAKCSTHQTWCLVYWSSSCAVCWWPIFRKLGTCSTTDALSPRTLLTENICESVQQILQHSPAKKEKKKKEGSTHQRWCLSLLVLFLCSVLVADFQEAWHLLHDGRLVAYDTSNKKTFVKVCNKYSNIPRQKK